MRESMIADVLFLNWLLALLIAFLSSGATRCLPFLGFDAFFLGARFGTLMGSTTSSNNGITGSCGGGLAVLPSSADLVLIDVLRS
jgi:hypothetical protein